jgi:hypothetical protein
MQGFAPSVSRVLGQAFAPILLAVSIFACSYKTPPEKTPPPNNQAVEKSFFRTPDGNGGSQAKNFVCGWAPLNEIGMISEWTLVNNAHTIPACNIQFLIEQNMLIAKQVNPSVPPTQWATVFTIPITSHFNFVAAEDKYGRPTREMVYDQTRDDWNARTHMTLNWQGAETHDFAYEMLYGGARVLAVADVEITNQNGKSFLGMTLSVTSPVFGSMHQADIRMNFLEFTSEPVNSFRPRIYHDDNSNHFGAIWGMGRDVEGVNPVAFVARWDLRPESIPHEICFNGFEANAQARMAKQLAIDSMEEWNASLERIGAVPAGRKAFIESPRKMRHAFDLRCSSITYVADQRISERSPLGIGMAQADVNNGKILWGGMVIYGGALERYVEAYRGSGAKSSNTRAPVGAVFSSRIGEMVFGGNPLAHMNPPQLRDQPIARTERLSSSDSLNQLRLASQNASRMGVSSFIGGLGELGLDEGAQNSLLGRGNLSEMIQAFRQARANAAGENANSESERRSVDAAIASLTRQFHAAQQNSRQLDARLTESLEGVRNYSQDSTLSVAQLLREENWQRLLVGGETLSAHALTQEAVFGANWRSMSPEEKETRLMSAHRNRFARLHNSNMFDLDNTIEDFVAELQNLPEDLKGRSTDEIIAVSLKKTILHEFGHMLGLAHNFKDNILPAEGTVPEKHRAKLVADSEKPYSPNVTTIMGYPHPYHMLVKTIDEINVGPQDELTLRYLYKNEYSTFKAGDEDFTYRQVPESGRIPSRNQVLRDGSRVAYFPNCTDYVEWFGLDPYCNRWDRGHDAKTIVQGYLDDFEQNNIRKLENLVDTGTSSFHAEYFLWVKSLTHFGRVRKFYDHMRYTYRNEIRQMARGDGRNLFAFEKCNGPEQRNQLVKGIFERSNPEFANLCEANAMAIERMAKQIRDTGPDFTTFVNEESAVPVAEITSGRFQSWSRMHGTWTSLGTLPMKLSALFTLTSPVPYRNHGAWVMPIRTYSRSGPNTKYTYASLYPAAFTKEVSQSTLANLKFVADEEPSAQMGRIALYMGSFLGETFRDFQSTNDFHEFPAAYMRTIRDQTRFLFDYDNAFVPILIRAVRDTSPGARPEMVKSFTAEIYVWGQNSIQLGDAFMLPQGKVFFRATAKTFVHPVSEIFFLSDDLALVWGIRVNYDTDNYSDLSADGFKTKLHEKYNRVIDTCLKTAKLENYFKKSNSKFNGFVLNSGIAGNENRYRDFTNSVDAEFQNYWADPAYGNNDERFRNTCGRALDDVGLVITQALTMINVWMPQITEYLVK